MQMNPADLVSIAGARPAVRPIHRVVNRFATVLTCLAATTLGCVRTEVVELPLIDALQPPIVLREGRNVRLPNTGPGNRFVSGWRFEETSAELTIEPAAAGARLEIVQMHPRPRTLALSTRGDVSGLVVSAAIGFRQVDVQTSGSNIEILLPADLEQGRHLVDLEFADPSGVEISGGSLSAAERSGRVDFEGDDIVHEGWSAIDFVRWVEPGTRLVGEFVPPPDASPEQRFALLLDRGDGTLETVVEIRPSSRSPGEPVSLLDPLRETSGLVRIRLVAEGEGGAGRWRGLRLRSREPKKVTAIERVPEPPRLAVVYVFDALRSDAVGHLGSVPDVTPCIDRLAAEGAVFANHFSVAPNTGPATISLFTGYGFLRGRTIPDTEPVTLAEDFAGAGYRTVSISSNPHLSPSFGLTRGFDDIVFDAIDEGFDDEARSTINDSADRVHQAALRWLDGLRPGEPAFLYLHTLNPHNPYTPPEPYPSRFVLSDDSSIDGSTKTLAAIRDRDWDVSPQDERRIREWYTAGVAYNDAALCHFVEELKQRFDSRFLLVVTSDHGEELFDHDGVLHGYTLYDEQLHVPLVVWWPEAVRPARVEEASDTLDLTGGLRALVARRGIEKPAGGMGLWAAIGGARTTVGGPTLHFATAPGLRRAAMVSSARWKLISVPRPRFGWGMGKGRGRTHDAEYVFNLTGDPAEEINLAGAADLEVDWLRSRLSGWLEYWDSRQPDVDDSRPDEETRRRLKALGYTD